jgi:GAF domain-containing protein
MKDTKDYFKTICRVSRALGSTLKYEQVLDLIVTSAVETMGGKAAALFLQDPEKQLFRPVAQKGLSESYLHAEPHQARKEVVDVLAGGHLAVADATTDPRVSNHDAKKTEGVVSILVVPVTVKGNIIGVLTLYTAEQRDFSPEDIDFLTALAEQGGMAIDHAKLFKRIRANSRLFLDLATNINASLDIRLILHNLTVSLSEALGMKGGLIRLLNKDSNELELVASHGLSDTFLDKGPVSVPKSMAAVLDGETVTILDATTDDRVQYPEACRDEGIASMLVVPIKVRDEVIGLLRLCSAAQREFPLDLIMLVQALAGQGGLAIQNASMYLKLEEDKASLEQDIWSHRMWF